MRHELDRLGFLLSEPAALRPGYREMFLKRQHRIMRLLALYEADAFPDEGV